MTLADINRRALLVRDRILSGDDEALDAFTRQVRPELLGMIDLRTVQRRIPAEELGRLLQLSWFEALLLWQPSKEDFANTYVRRLRRAAGDWFCRERGLLAAVMEAV